MPTRLTTTDIRTLRSKIRHGQHRRAGVTYKPVTLVGGPHASIDAGLGPEAIIGWCCQTSTGPVQILYRHADGNRWRLDAVESPT